MFLTGAASGYAMANDLGLILKALRKEQGWPPNMLANELNSFLSNVFKTASDDDKKRKIQEMYLMIDGLLNKVRLPILEPNITGEDCTLLEDIQYERTPGLDDENADYDIVPKVDSGDAYLKKLHFGVMNVFYALRSGILISAPYSAGKSAIIEHLTDTILMVRGNIERNIVTKATITTTTEADPTTQASTKTAATVRGHSFMGKHNPQSRHRRNLQPHATKRRLPTLCRFNDREPHRPRNNRQCNQSQRKTDCRMGIFA